MLGRQLAAQPTEQPPRPDQAITFSSGICFPAALLGATAALPALDTPWPVVDGEGHSRPVYRGLFAYAVLRALQLVHPQVRAAQADPLLQPLMAWCTLPDANVIESATERRAENAWNALAIAVAGKILERPGLSLLAARTFEDLAHAQQPSGALFPHDSSANPETRWYEELQLLHAMATFSVQAKNEAIYRTVQRAAEYHLAETQPDHATQQPWAIFAFLSSAKTAIVAQEMFHTTEMRSQSGMDAISLILLADALWCLQRVQVEGWMSTTSS